MPKTTKRTSHYKSNGATLGFEEKLWAAADKLRAHGTGSAMRGVILFVLVERLEASWQYVQGRMAQLTPSLLAKAFRGELVAQEAWVKSAEVLLDRLE